MPLDPQCQALIDFINQAGGSPFNADDYTAARDAYRKTIALYSHPTPRLAAVNDRIICGPANDDLAVRIYQPTNQAGVVPALVFFHGGGWAVGDLDTHDHVCRYLAAHAEIVIVSVDYRLAPEHPFPAPLDDCIQAVHWVFDNAEALGINNTQIAVGGDSAGGNLAAAVCLELREHPDLNLAFQLLIYPTCDFTADHPSMRENGNGYLLTVEAMQKFTQWYLPDEELKKDHRASPQLANSHNGLPPAYVITAGYDPLRDEGQRYAETLTRAGVETQQICYDGMVHGFLRMGAKLEVAIQALDAICVALKSALHR